MKALGVMLISIFQNFSFFCIFFSFLEIIKIKTLRRKIMKATGVVRRIDDLGRVVIPKEIRKTLRIKER